MDAIITLTKQFPVKDWSEVLHKHDNPFENGNDNEPDNDHFIEPGNEHETLINIKKNKVYKRRSDSDDVIIEMDLLEEHSINYKTQEYITSIFFDLDVKIVNLENILKEFYDFNSDTNNLTQRYDFCVNEIKLLMQKSYNMLKGMDKRDPLYNNIYSNLLFRLTKYNERINSTNSKFMKIKDQSRQYDVYNLSEPKLPTVIKLPTITIKPTEIIKQNQKIDPPGQNQNKGGNSHSRAHSYSAGDTIKFDPNQDQGQEEQLQIQILSPHEDVQKRRMELDMMSRNTDILDQRNFEIESILKSITELQQMFLDLKIMIEEQGEMLLRVDAHIISTVEKTIAAKKDLIVSENTQKNTSKCCIGLSIGLIIFIVIMASILAFIITQKNGLHIGNGN
ncbi:MAG: hypothetical protein Terrestrivirus9_5 [Terrestrivirus sp.]|uniref:t-SNARE coiled-coil homology domain-containing protein n=1 Tax=Terrestrivirus sp. TaxID=2487775 RepID=A0A3G4ZNX6_9VIRU|nr:MAG: hypothetical protein Terrestrivirus9_5 [Terrestrivirus sp.]